MAEYDCEDPDFDRWIAFVVDKVGVKHFYQRVAGVSYKNADGSSRQKAIKKCLPRHQLLLVRDIGNQHDENAVKVLTMLGEQVGFLESRCAEELTNRARRGDRFSCFVRSVQLAEGTRTYGMIVAIVQCNDEIAAEQRRKELGS